MFCIFEGCNHISLGPHTPRLNRSSPAHPFPQTAVSGPPTVLRLLRSSPPWSIPSLTRMQPSSQSPPAAKGADVHQEPAAGADRTGRVLGELGLCKAIGHGGRAEPCSQPGLQAQRSAQWSPCVIAVTQRKISLHSPPAELLAAVLGLCFHK